MIRALLLFAALASTSMGSVRAEPPASAPSPAPGVVADDLPALPSIVRSGSVGQALAWLGGAAPDSRSSAFGALGEQFAPRSSPALVARLTAARAAAAGHRAYAAADALARGGFLSFPRTAPPLRLV